VPGVMKMEIYKKAHADPTAGHFGVWKTVKRIRQTFYFAGLDKFVKEQIWKCEMCEQRRNPVPQRRAHLQSTTVSRPL
jgi:hypothetical protein